ncbi:hypothetical protein [Costertonia aggregata]|uniref:Uncharacterized protein n=1 Tax=Costertonia aggregata TaxID=343403 RepID=A0A7H9AQV3_9FLAO|nr:hypothetical protein [Costertonia aggregata]QLG45779.1 hypothetical protein HYG79_10600 [Costertonia aggregata]
MMSKFAGFLALYLLFGCSTDKLNDISVSESSLANKEVVLDNVIACAASNENDDLVSVFLYPRPGATNIRYYETTDTRLDKNDFDNYTLVDFPLVDVFNGYLKKFEVPANKEKWAIVSFDEAGLTHVSNPIRLKQETKPTEYLPQNVSINASSNMPIFSWTDGTYDDTVIYFQVVSDQLGNLISGTYTIEKNFQFYKLDNVVLNITKSTPENLNRNQPYKFTMLAVSEDNWVNLFTEVDFTIE